MKDKHIHNMHKFPIRIKVFDEDAIHDIKEFEINNSKDNKFISDNKNLEFCTKDLQYIILYPDVFESIIDDLYSKGYEQGFKASKKKKTENVEE